MVEKHQTRLRLHAFVHITHQQFGGEKRHRGFFSEFGVKIANPIVVFAAVGFYGSGSRALEKTGRKHALTGIKSASKAGD